MQVENEENKVTESDDTALMQSTKKLTTTATVIFKCSSPCPLGDTSDITSNEPVKSKTFKSKNMFEELKEQSAKITSSARLRFALNRQNSHEGDSQAIKRLGSQEDSQPVNNVMKNVAEFEKRLNVAGRVPNNGEIDTSSMRMSKSCIEEFVPNNDTLQKGGIYIVK